MEVPVDASDQDFVSVLRHVPRLLEACIRNDVPSMRTLRLVCKEASRVALRGLTSFTVRLSDVRGYANVNGARMVRQTQLSELKVSLPWSGSSKAAFWLARFVVEAKLSLATVRTLDLSFNDTEDMGNAAFRLTAAFGMCGAACPDIVLDMVAGHQAMAFMQCLGEACPHVSSIIIHINEWEVSMIPEVMTALPSLLPNLDALCLPDLNREIPDMSSIKSRVAVIMNACCLASVSMWRCLPPNLKFLRVGHFIIGPQAGMQDGVAAFPCLLAVDVWAPTGVFLASLVQLLHAAPALNSFRFFAVHRGNFTYEPVHVIDHNIICGGSLSDAAGLAFIHERMNINLVTDVSLRFSGFDEDSASHQTFCHAIPSSVHFRKCVFDEVTPLQILPLLSAFPNLSSVHLMSPKDLDDCTLQIFASCTTLTHLGIWFGQDISHLGLFELCLRLRSLISVRVHQCTHAQEPFLRRSVRLLEHHNVFVSMLESG